MPAAVQKEKHIHKFRRHKYRTGSVVYFCAGGDCTIKMVPAMAIGKTSICWRCGEPFQMNEYSVRLAKPHCEKCHQPKASKDNKEEYTEEESPSTSNTPSPVISLSERLKQTISALKPAEPLPDEEDEL